MRNLEKMEHEGIALQYGNRAGLTVKETVAIMNEFTDKAAHGGAGLIDLIFKCFSLGVAAGSRLEKSRQSKTTQTERGAHRRQQGTPCATDPTGNPRQGTPCNFSGECTPTAPTTF